MDVAIFQVDPDLAAASTVRQYVQKAKDRLYLYFRGELLSTISLYRISLLSLQHGLMHRNSEQDW